jgi:hypothetical protein
MLSFAIKWHGDQSPPVLRLLNHQSGYCSRTGGGHQPAIGRGAQLKAIAIIH